MTSKQGRAASDGIDSLVALDQVRLLMTTAEVKSFSAAAVQLGVSQPYISQQVRRLERLAGRPLFRRSRRGVELTGDGEAVVVYARSMLSLTEDLRRHFEQTDGRARVSIGMSEDLCRTALPIILQLLLREYPLIDLQVVSGNYAVLEEAIKSGTVDFAVMRRYAAFSDAVVIFSEPLAWVGQPRLLGPIRDPVPLVLEVKPNPARVPPIDALHTAGRTWQVRFEGSGIASMEAALQAGYGVTAAPASMRLYEVTKLDPSSGLPLLPDVHYVMVGPEPGASGLTRACAELVRRASSQNFEYSHGKSR